MSVDVKRLPHSQVELEITIEPTEMLGAMDKAYARLVNQVSIPGFRKGKAPRAMVERMVGPVAVFQEAVEIAVGAAYERALTENNLQPLAQPQIDIPEAGTMEPDPNRPLTFTATVPVQPDVVLSDLHALRVDPPNLEIGPDEVDRVLNRLQEDQAPWQAVDDQLAENGNQVTMALKAVIGEETLIDQDAFEYVLREDEAQWVPIPELSEHVRGHGVGEVLGYDVVLPAEYLPAEYAGQTMHVDITLHNIERKSLPQLDDDFAKALGSFETLDEVRDAIKQSMAMTKQREVMDQYVSDIIQRAAENAQIELPDVLIDEELERMIADLRAQIENGRRMTMEQYLQIGGRTFDDVRTEMRPGAEARVRSNLVLEEVARREGVDAPEEEVERELLSMAGLPTLKNRDKRRLLTSPSVRERVATRLRRRYAILRLLQLVAPPPGGDAAAGDGAEIVQPAAMPALTEGVAETPVASGAVDEAGTDEADSSASPVGLSEGAGPGEAPDAPRPVGAEDGESTSNAVGSSSPASAEEG